MKLNQSKRSKNKNANMTTVFVFESNDDPLSTDSNFTMPPQKSQKCFTSQNVDNISSNMRF